jgi:hypothetical protein
MLSRPFLFFPTRSGHKSGHTGGHTVRRAVYEFQTVQPQTPDKKHKPRMPPDMALVGAGFVLSC